MSAFLRSHSRVATIALALSIGVAGLATPAAALGTGHGSPNWTHGNSFHTGGNFRGHGNWGRGNFGGGWGGAGIGAAVVGGLVGGAILGSAGYAYQGDPCWQYQDSYGPNGQYLGRQLVDTCVQ